MTYIDEPTQIDVANGVMENLNLFNAFHESDLISWPYNKYPNAARIRGVTEFPISDLDTPIVQSKLVIKLHKLMSENWRDLYTLVKGRVLDDFI